MSRIKFNVITIALAAVLCIALVFALGFGVKGGTIATAGGLDNTGIDNGGSSIIDKGDIGGVFKSNVELPSNNNGDIKFYGGTFEIGIFKNGYEFADLIGSGCEYRDIQTSVTINVSELKNSVPFKVVCDHTWASGVCTICKKVCSHSGGKATCIEKAICEICGEEYGAYDENCHEHLVEVKATASTVTTAGNIAHYHCTDCDKRFSDVLAINEVTLESVALPKLPPAVVSGGEGKYVKNSGESLTVKSNALLSDFVAVYVDGKEISLDNYVLGEDGLSVKFKSAYLDSCEVGTHEVSLRSISGNADTTFTIESAPDEGLSGGAWAGIGIAIAAAVIGAMMGIMLAVKKRG